MGRTVGLLVFRATRSDRAPVLAAAVVVAWGPTGSMDPSRMCTGISPRGASSTTCFPPSEASTSEWSNALYHLP